VLWRFKKTSDVREIVPIGYAAVFGPHLEDSERDLCISTQARFRHRLVTYFGSFWVAMLGLYVIFAVQALQQWSAGKGGTERAQNPYVSFLTFMGETLTLLVIFQCFAALLYPGRDGASRRKYRVLVRFSRCVTALLLAAFPLLLSTVVYGEHATITLSEFRVLFGGLVGALSAVGLALFIARLDSKLMALPTWQITILLTYAAIQPLEVTFYLVGQDYESIAMGAMIAGLCFKVSLFLVVQYLMQSGALWTYADCFPILCRRIDSIFENQF